MGLVMMNTVLIVDDDAALLNVLARMLGQAGYVATVAADGEAALGEIAAKPPDILLLDLKLPGMDGLAVLEQTRKITADCRVIMLTGHGEIKDAVKAMRMGAFDVLSKPVKCEDLLAVVKLALESRGLNGVLSGAGPQAAEAQGQPARKDFHAYSPGVPSDSVGVIGDSPALRTVLKLVKLVAPTTMTVVLQGESGVGKGMLANLIHQRSRRREKPFVPVDCGTMPEQLAESILFGHEKGAFTGATDAKKGLFEHGHEGTVFLDEILNASLAVQMNMLRIVQEKKLRHVGGKNDIPVDVRIITASNVNLSEAVKAGQLRLDLFYRLTEFVINVPPLRERRDDIPVLAHHFLETANLEMQKGISGFSDKAMSLLLDAPWPGNVRELKNVVRRAVLLAESNTITPDQIAIGEIDRFIVPIPGAHPADGATSVKGKVAAAREEIEKKELSRALLDAGGNKSKAARILKIDRTTLYAKMGKYGLP